MQWPTHAWSVPPRQHKLSSSSHYDIAGAAAAAAAAARASLPTATLCEQPPPHVQSGMADAADDSSSPRKRPRVDVSLDGKKIALLTGALGGIGAATATVLRESGYEVIGMDRSAGESAADHFLQCDIRAFHADANSVRRYFRPFSLGRLVARCRYRLTDLRLLDLR